MLTLYPEIQPYTDGLLDVGDGHRLYFEQCGNPQGIPVLFVHGGPGGGASESSRRFFDPKKYRIVLFDQRGCGRSTPHGSLDHNTTQALIEDIERLRLHLNIGRWLLFGGSWGATLSLLYAQQHPQRVSGLILRGIFLSRRQDIEWFYQDGASNIYPDFWQHFIDPIAADDRDDLIQAYYQLLTSENDIARMAAAKSWTEWEARCSTLEPSQGLLNRFADPHTALALSRLEAHYFIHDAFLEENQILNQCDRIQEIPVTLVHGRYDMVCPVKQAYELYQALPQSELHIVRDAGHSAMEPGITDNLIKATREFALRLA